LKGREPALGGACARVAGVVCARAPSLISVHAPVFRGGDMMVDGVSPGAELRPLGLWKAGHG
jgi:hypothetical protein